MKRGALIVIEGIDRTGKSTQAKALVSSLQKKQINVEYSNFPARETPIGKVINSYLTSKNDLPDEAIHLLFSANRWEMVNQIKKKLDSGISIIVDRYCYSGVAFSAAKGLPIDWCKSPDVGLPRPDRVFFLTLPLECAEKRNGFGNERYEVMDFQKKVAYVYEKLKEDNWDVLDASRSMQVIHDELLKKCLDVIDAVTDKPLDKMWTKPLKQQDQ